MTYIICVRETERINKPGSLSLSLGPPVMRAMGHPFKSGPLRIRTRNGSYVMVTTEWSSFTNPWDHKLELIITQHTVIK